MELANILILQITLMRTMELLTSSSLALSLLLLGLSQTPAKGFTLDAFTDLEGSNILQRARTEDFDPNGTVASDEDINLDSTVFGGQRTIKVTRNSGSAIDIISLTIFDGNATLQSGLIGSSEIIWDGNDLSNTPTDITTEGGTEQRSIQLNVLALNLGTGDNDIQFNFELRDTSDNVATISQLITTNISSANSLFFAYQDRVESTSDAGGDISLDDVDYIRFYTSDEDNGDDFQFDFLQTSQSVPFGFSPALGIIIGGSFIGFNILKKRIAE